MLDEFRSTNITWDKATSRIYSPVTANASDENGRKLVVQIVNGGQVEDLTGATLHLYWETRDKAHDGLDVFKAVDLEKGEFELSYTTGMLSNKGVLNANLVLIDTVGRVVSERFKITVTEGIDDDAIQSSDSFTALTQALIDISNLEQNYAPRLNDLTAQLQHKVGGGNLASMADLGQDVKEAMTGGSVAVVGVGAVNTTNIVDGAVTVEKTDLFNTGENLFDKRKIQNGAYVRPDGTIVNDEKYFYYIIRNPRKNTYINWSGSNGSGRVARFITVYDVNDLAIADSGRDAALIPENESKAFMIPASAEKIVLTYSTAYISNDADLMISYSQSKPTYESFKIIPDDKMTLNANQLSQITNASPLSGKDVYVFGDSILYGHATGISCMDLLASTHSFNLQKFAVNGAKLSDITNQINNAPASKPDVIVFDGGANDNNVQSNVLNLGELTKGYSATLDTTTIYGASESILKTAINKYPGTPIVFILVHKLYTRDLTSQDLVAQALVDSCDKWGASIVDLYHGSSFNTFIPAIRAEYTYDSLADLKNGNGTHPNAQGYERFYVPQIRAKLLELL